jgi:hypothetical protein
MKENSRFNNSYMIWELQISIVIHVYIIHYVNDEAATTGLMMPPGINSPPAEVSTQWL